MYLLKSDNYNKLINLNIIWVGKDEGRILVSYFNSSSKTVSSIVLLIF